MGLGAHLAWPVRILREALGDLDPDRVRVQKRFSAEAMVAGYRRIYQYVLAVATKGDGPWT